MECCHELSTLISPEIALDQICRSIAPISQCEQLPLDQLSGRILAEDIISSIDLPRYDNSAMDGYALRSIDVGRFEVFDQIDKSFAGRPAAKPVGAGQCIRIMTGAQIPDGADAVVRQEDVSVIDGKIQLRTKVHPGDAIRLRGEDQRAGAPLMQIGDRITPVDIGMLASTGIKQARVYRPLIIAIFSTGDELRQPEQTLEPGTIYDANRPLLKALLAQSGFKVLDLGIIRDDPEAIRNAVVRADTEADVLLTSGGVSVGEADYTREVLDKIGKIDIWKLAIKPGKPLAFGRLPNSYFFGLPGNPVAATVTYHQIALPALIRLAGGTAITRTRLKAITDGRLKKAVGRTEFQRGVWYLDEFNKIHVRPLQNQSSGALSSLCKANCYIVLEQNRSAVEPGEDVVVELFDSNLKGG